jgi:hypothetical protein
MCWMTLFLHLGAIMLKLASHIFDFIAATIHLQRGIGAVAEQMAARLSPGCVELQQKVDKVCIPYLSSCRQGCLCGT